METVTDGPVTKEGVVRFAGMETKRFHRKGKTMRLRGIAVLAMMGIFASPAVASLEEVDTQTGLITFSVDGLGTNNPSGFLEYEKPAGGTVRRIYVAAVSNFDRLIEDGDVMIDAGSGPVGLAFDTCVFNDKGGFFHNCFVDATAELAADLNAAPAGLNSVEVFEVDTETIDGVVMGVVWNDPNATVARSVVVLFGGRSPDGASFTITPPEPLDLGEGVADLGVGISFSFQGSSGGGQVTEIEVNGERITSSAGGEDDGTEVDGALLTIGGLGDTNGNPDPFDPPTDLRFDDELYDLLPFVQSGDTSIEVETFNPSNNDNLFFAHFVTAFPAIICDCPPFLSPISENCIVGSECCVTANVVDEDGNPDVGREVGFEIFSGPHAGLIRSDLADENGEASFCYTGFDVGTDLLIACVTNADGEELCSNTVEKVWAECILFAGIDPIAQPFDDPFAGPEDIQYVRQRGQFAWPVLETSIPTIRVPDRPQFDGLTFRMQIWMRNPIVFPDDPFQASNALEWVVGGGPPAEIGDAAYIWFFGEPAELGEDLVLGFDVIGI